MLKNKIRVWAIVASVLLVVFIIATSLLYIQNNDLKNKNDKLSANLTSAQSAKSKSDKDLVDIKTSVSQKLNVLKILLSDNTTQDDQFKAYALIQSINNSTLTADWKAMQNNEPSNNDNYGQKMTQDIISASLKELK
jgi:hypothetical protein